MAIEFNDNIHVKINRPTDFRFGPFISIAQANATIPIAQRYHGLIFGVYTTPLSIVTSDIIYYYYWNGLSNTDIKQLGGKPPVDGSYANQAAMIAAQATQTAQYIYYDGTSYWEYLGTTNGNISDYREINNSITNPITGTGANGQLAFWNGTNTQSGDNGLLWDNGIKSLILNESETKIRFVRSGYRTFEIRQSSGTGLEFFNLTDSLSTLFLSSLARVGIATNNPTNTLDVNGTARIRTLSGSTGYLPLLSSTGVMGQSVVYDNGGNVGIGTSSPTAGNKLEVVGGNVLFNNSSDATNGLTIRNLSSGTSARASLSLFSDSATGFIHATSSSYNVVPSWLDSIVMVSSSDATGGIILNAQSGGIKFQTITVERMRITSSGEIGILTTSPTNTLDVNGTGRIRNGVSLADTSGNVLIGTTTDSGQRLQVNGSGYISGDLLIGTTNTATGQKVRISGGSLNITNWPTSSGAYDKLSINFGEDRGFGYDPNLNQIYVKGATNVPIKIFSEAPTDSLIVTLDGNTKIGGQIHTPIESKGNSGSGTVTFNWNDSNIQTVTLTGNCTFAFSNPESGASYQIVITQDGTGGRTITWPTVYWQNKTTPLLSNSANAVDVITLLYDGSKYLGIIDKNFGTP